MIRCVNKNVVVILSIKKAAVDNKKLKNYIQVDKKTSDLRIFLE